ncbi:MAG: hypothetical protein HYS08_06875 [Chlamydiae bacterium]|nr:hypothetical protein [Chlamydiota bacterium]MBI3265554.1 hypothetical protein [Chlamydiota bacterium]
MKRFSKMKGVTYALLVLCSLWGMPSYASHGHDGNTDNCSDFPGEDCYEGIQMSGELEGYTVFNVVLHDAFHTEVPGSISVAPVDLNGDGTASGSELVTTGDKHIIVSFDDNNVKRDIQIYMDNYEGDADLNGVPDYQQYEEGSIVTGASPSTLMKSGLIGAVDPDYVVPAFWHIAEGDGTPVAVTGNSGVEGYVTDIHAEDVDPLSSNYNKYSFLDSYANMAFAILGQNAALAASSGVCATTDTNGDGNIDCNTGYDTNGDGVVDTYRSDSAGCSTEDTNKDGVAGECGVLDSTDLNQDGSTTDLLYDFKNISSGSFQVTVGADYRGFPAQNYEGTLNVEIYTELTGDTNHHF